MNRKPSLRSRTNQGFILIAVIVVLSLSMALFGLWAQAAVRSHHFLLGEALRMEAGRLAESGIARAAIRRTADPDYVKETWSISAAELDGRHAGEVRLKVEPIEGGYRIESTAKYPMDAVHQAQVTKRIEIRNPAVENES